jgi:hypothetical protein
MGRIVCKNEGLSNPWTVYWQNLNASESGKAHFLIITPTGSIILKRIPIMYNGEAINGSSITIPNQSLLRSEIRRLIMYCFSCT